MLGQRRLPLASEAPKGSLCLLRFSAVRNDGGHDRPTPMAPGRRPPPSPWNTSMASWDAGGCEAHDRHHCSSRSGKQILAALATTARPRVLAPPPPQRGGGCSASSHRSGEAACLPLGEALPAFWVTVLTNAKAICFENKGRSFACSVPVKKLNAGLILPRPAGCGGKSSGTPGHPEYRAESLDSGSETRVQGPATALGQWRLGRII